jgi:4-hydroxybenzoate polyprenyltransferase|tara:strand:- start:21288 stop:22169 length:882 start_codon:yes stop_codon:yes gene_type:complete
MKKFIFSARPKQILKNTILFIPLFFTLNNWINLDINIIQDLFINSLFSFLVFICCSTIGYQMNDLIDKKFDIKHKIKKNRPIANGEINNLELFFFISLLFIIGIIFSVLVNKNVFFLYILYIFTSLLYSKFLKNIIILDVISITFFYIIRMLAGTFAIGYDVSVWLFILTFFLSLFIIIIKRIRESQKGLIFRNKNLSKFYSKPLFLKVIFSLYIANIIIYILYSISEILYDHRNLLFIISSLFFTLGISRYYFIIQKKKSGDFPEDIIIKDLYILILIILFIISLFISKILN